ncbi:transglycosylase family protein [Mycolicibacterium vaccae]|uniref:transglycosylase family protein n=1 Tax=Mycolicibacterium vaccae TaxID=1810 RepID=UPI003F491088
MAAPTAHAGTVDWDAFAHCESSGNWAANTGNGVYGGLQFLPSTWREHGGVGSPAQTPREYQIMVAERVLRTQGIGAGPSAALSPFPRGRRLLPVPAAHAASCPGSCWAAPSTSAGWGRRTVEPGERQSPVGSRPWGLGIPTDLETVATRIPAVQRRRPRENRPKNHRE